MTDAVIVLGAALAAPGVPGPALVRRVEHAVRVFVARQAAYLVVSGGIVSAPPTEAELMCELAVTLGVARERIVLEPLARNTFENIVYTAKIIRDRDWQRIAIVTDGFHMRRTLYVCRRLGVQVEGESVPRPAAMSWWKWAEAHAQERVRLARTAMLFRAGAHKPVLARVWNGSPVIARR